MAKAYYYHATTVDNAVSIIDVGCIKKGFDGVVYLCETPDEAMRFLRIRGVKDIVVFKVKLDVDKVVETFDHSEEFFKCKAYGCVDDISFTQMLWSTRYSF